MAVLGLNNPATIRLLFFFFLKTKSPEQQLTELFLEHPSYFYCTQKKIEILSLEQTPVFCSRGRSVDPVDARWSWNSFFSTWKTTPHSVLGRELEAAGKEPGHRPAVRGPGENTRDTPHASPPGCDSSATQRALRASARRSPGQVMSPTPRPPHPRSRARSPRLTLNGGSLCKN